MRWHAVICFLFMYLFLVGNNHALAKWELQSILPKMTWEQHPLGYTLPDKVGENLNWVELQNRLGGTREIICFHDTDFSTWESALPVLQGWIGNQVGREVTLIAPAIHDKAREIMLRQIKRCFDRPIRYRCDKRYLLKENGIVFWWVEKEIGKFNFGYSVAQQDVDAYAKRDYGKPVRSMTRGMLPPKLAQIMINGIQPTKIDRVWDPFCGTGTVLIEAALMNILTIGSDKDTSALQSTKENISHLLTHQQQATIGQIWQQDVTLPWQDYVTQATAIVAEGYLGKPQKEQVSNPSALRPFWQDVEPLYQKFFTRLLKSSITRMVLATPLVQTNNDLSRLAVRTWNILLQAGWKKVFQADYIRTGQIVGREITYLMQDAKFNMQNA